MGGSQVHSNARFIGRSVNFVNNVDLLEVPLYADLKVNHIHIDGICVAYALIIFKLWVTPKKNWIEILL